jgi:hypothetical protein
MFEQLEWLFGINQTAVLVLKLAEKAQREPKCILNVCEELDMEYGC